MDELQETFESVDHLRIHRELSRVWSWERYGQHVAKEYLGPLIDHVIYKLSRDLARIKRRGGSTIPTHALCDRLERAVERPLRALVRAARPRRGWRT